MSIEIRNNIADLDRLDHENRVVKMIEVLVKHCGTKYKDGMLPSRRGAVLWGLSSSSQTATISMII